MILIILITKFYLIVDDDDDTICEYIKISSTKLGHEMHECMHEGQSSIVDFHDGQF